MKNRKDRENYIYENFADKELPPDGAKRLSVGRILRWFLYTVILCVYAIIFLRLCAQRTPEMFRRIYWTADAYEAAVAAEKEGTSLSVFSQEPSSAMAKDGRASISDIFYIKELDQIQFTLRFNKSTYEALSEEYGITAENGSMPWEFILRDDAGELYRGFSYISDVSGRYTFFRVVFDGVDLFRVETADTHPGVPSEKNGYIYKGQNAAAEVRGAVSFLYLDIYYSEDADTEGEPFCYPLMVYRSSLEFPKEMYELPDSPDGFREFVPAEK